MHPYSTQSAPQAEQESFFRIFLLSGGDLEVEVVPLVVLDLILKVINFFEEKSAPQTISWLRLCPVPISEVITSSSAIAERSRCRVG